MLQQLRHGGEQVRHQAVVGHGEDRRVRILVDGDDHLGILHARQVLDGAGDADGDVELRRDDLAGLPDLPVVGRIARVDRGARRAQARAQALGQGLEHLEVLRRAHPASARDDHLGRLQVGPVRLGHLATDKARQSAVGHRGDAFHRCRSAFGGRIETRRAHGGDDQAIGALHRGNGIAGVDRSGEGIGREHRDDLGDLRAVEARGDARQDVLARAAGRREDVRVAVGQRQHLQGQVLRQAIGQVRRVGQQHLADAGNASRLARHLGAAAAGHQHVGAAGRLQGRGDDVARRWLESLVVVFRQYQRFAHVASPIDPSPVPGPVARRAADLTGSPWLRRAACSPGSPRRQP